MTFLFALLTAALPVSFWYFIIIRKKRRGMNFFFWLGFILAMLFAMVFKNFEPEIGSFLRKDLGVNILLSYIAIGILIEYGKNFIVRIIGKNYFQGIDDVIDLSFATALGFTFYENALYFNALFGLSISYGTPIEILKEILIHEFFILPIHLFCSGIFGYYYGVSLFAEDEIIEEKDGKEESVTKKASFGFRSFQILKGTIISTLVYGLFFMLKEIDPAVLDIISLFGWHSFPLNEKVMPIISFGFFNVGTLFLFHLMEQKKFIIQHKNLAEKKK